MRASFSGLNAPLAERLTFDPTLTAVAAMMNDRLCTFGPDALTAAVLSTGGVAAHVAQLNQANEYARTVMRPQWEAFGGVSAAVDRLYTVPSITERITSLPGYLSLASVIEPYASARSLFLFTPPGVDFDAPLVLDVMAEEVLEELGEEFADRLAKYGPDLVNTVLGAWDVARSESRDRVRQAATSIRTAIEDVIKMIAPIEAARAWAHLKGLGNKGAVPEGAHGARSAAKWAPQIRFIFRFADEVVGDNSLVGDVGEADLADMLLLLERLNSAVHTSQREIELDDLTLVLRRGTALITLFLDAHEMDKS
jgi:hypothetical protein